MTAQGSQPGKDVLADYRVQVAGLKIPETTPAKILVGPLLAVVTLGKTKGCGGNIFARDSANGDSTM